MREGRVFPVIDHIPDFEWQTLETIQGLIGLHYQERGVGVFIDSYYTLYSQKLGLAVEDTNNH